MPKKKSSTGTWFKGTYFVVEEAESELMFYY